MPPDELGGRYPRTRFRRRKAIRGDLDKLIRRIREDAPVGLHLGCGSDYIPGLINCDAYSEKADRRLDAINLHEFSDRSVDLIETHHMIEHLSAEHARRAMVEWARVLRPGGLLVLSCPDLDLIARAWRKADKERKQRLLPMLYGSQENDGMFHRSGYTRELIGEQLHVCGFSVEFSYAPYPSRSTPSLIVFARRGPD